MKMNLAICISGGGTTSREIIRATKDHRLLRTKPALIIASQPDAGGIIKALEEGINDNDIIVLSRSDFENSRAYGEAILKECRARRIDLIALCGFIPHMPSDVINEYRTRIFNQHPGPIDGVRPGFGGKGMYGQRVHHAVLYFARNTNRPFRTECVVHRVTDEVDGGALLGVKPVMILPGDDAPTLAARVLPHEHELVVETIMKFSEFGGPQEIKRELPLILNRDEILLLNKAKKVGIKAFPGG